MDQIQTVAVTRPGERNRVDGTATGLTGCSLADRGARRDTLDYMLSDLFPRGDVAKAAARAGCGR
jgi:hypothetical protein